MTGSTTVGLEKVPPRRSVRWSPSVVLVTGLALISFYISLLFALMTHAGYGTWAALLVAPVLVALTLPALRWEARRRGERGLFRFLLVVLLLHLGLAWVGHYVAFDYYGGEADVALYTRVGWDLARGLREGNFAVHLEGGIGGTNWPGFLTGLLYTVTGPTTLGGFLFYAWLGFWGLLYLYRAFRLAAPEGSSQSYARLLFLFPPVAFWSSFMGKDSWMVFGLGIAVYGVAHVLGGRMRKGMVPFLIGTACMLIVRPHIAGMVGVALVFAYLVRRPGDQMRQLAPMAKVLGLVVVTALALALAIRTERFLTSSGIDTSSGLTNALYQTSRGAAYGGSGFTPPVVSGPTQFPAAAFTVLFRPLPLEARGLLERLAATAGTFLLVLTLVRWRWGVAALASIRRQPFVAFCIAYVVLAIIGFSAFANFGLLDRQRSQLLPIYFVLLSIPPTTVLGSRAQEGKHAPATDRARHDG